MDCFYYYHHHPYKEQQIQSHCTKGVQQRLKQWLLRQRVIRRKFFMCFITWSAHYTSVCLSIHVTVCLYLLPESKGWGSYREVKSAWIRAAAGPGRSLARWVWGLGYHLHDSAGWQRRRVPGLESLDTPGLLEALEGQRDRSRLWTTEKVIQGQNNCFVLDSPLCVSQKRSRSEEICVPYRAFLTWMYASLIRQNKLSNNHAYCLR